MNKVVFPKGIINIDYPRQGISDIIQAGFTKTILDFSMCNAEIGIEKKEMDKKSYNRCLNMIESKKEIYKRMEILFTRCKEENLDCSFAIAPYLPRDTKKDEMNALIEYLTKKSINTCGKLGCKYILVRPLFVGISEENIWEMNYEYYLRLAFLAKNNNLMILLENQCKDVNGHLMRGIFSEGETGKEWIDNLNAKVGEERFGFCMNVGVCNLNGQNMYDFVLALGSRIKAVILKDCDGDKENSMLPFTCVNNGKSKTDWLNLIRGLRKIKYNGYLLMDFEDTIKAFSPVLHPGILQLAKAVAEYFNWQIQMEYSLKKSSSRVLFGAGNMCRNYIKCYAKKNPPLYICDNKKEIWGSDFFGFEVKAPESLLELPQNCVIIICNIYYREIEEQLRKMGIKNPIEYFSDEYMPTFFFDRLKMKGAYDDTVRSTD